MTGQGERGSRRRRLVYCVVPAELASKLHEPLRRHFAADSEVEVVVEQRSRERRRRDERRAAEAATGAAGRAGTGEPERRRIHNLGGRRVADRRAVLVPGEQLSDLPRRLRPYADRLVLVERMEPASQEAEDSDTARVVIAFQAGEHERFAELYLRYFDRVYNYLHAAVSDAHEAEDLTQQVFTQMLEALPRYELRGQPFRAWLFRIARNQALDLLKKRGRLTVLETADLDREREREAALEPESELPVLDWLSDRELLLFVDRLPSLQRQVLVLRYMLGLTLREVSEVLEISRNHTAVLHYRALAFLRARLTSLGRTPKSHRRSPVRRGIDQSRVLRFRRFALTP